VTNTTATLSLGTAIVLGFGPTGTFRGTGAATAYVANRWYHFEIRSIDWTAQTYTVHVDGQLTGAAVPFAAASTGTVTTVDLSVSTTSTTALSVQALFDEIVVR
jgi:hypothetical protein